MALNRVGQVKTLWQLLPQLKVWFFWLNSHGADDVRAERVIQTQSDTVRHSHPKDPKSYVKDVKDVKGG